MKVEIQVTPKVTIQAEGKTHVEIFEQISALQEVFGTFDKCGKCGCTTLRFVVRVDKEDNKYYELHCQNPKCRARLSFGQNKGEKAGSLYPRNKETKKQTIMKGELDPGDYLPDNGWLKWNRQKECNE